MPGRNIIVVGASAGGVEALKSLVHQLPADLPAAIFVVLHVSPRGTSVLPQILTRSGPLPASHATDGETIQMGRIYVAPPDVHLVLERGGSVRLVRGPRENGHRPSVDALFRSAARSFGRRVLGVVLSGALDDGTAGLVAVKQRGGIAIVQDPADALFPGMPLNALRQAEVDHRLPVAEIGPLLDRLARASLEEESEPPMPEEEKVEIELTELSLEAIGGDHPGTPSGFGCPDCGGALWEIRGGDLVRFRCRVGHAWSAQSLLGRQSDALEEALWVALRALEERATLASRLADRMRQRGILRSAARYEEQMADCQRQAALIREILLTPPRQAGAARSPGMESPLEPDWDREDAQHGESN
jgi:two-component system chemotaxis response regulator CheB